MLLTFSKLGFSFQSIWAYCLGLQIICFRLDAVILPLRSCIQSETLSPCPSAPANEGAVLVLVPEREDAALPARHCVARREACRVLAGRVASDVGAGTGVVPIIGQQRGQRESVKL